VAEATKAGGEWQICVDFRTLRLKIVNHYFPADLRNLQFQLHHFEANPPVNLRILLQFLQLQKDSSE
jgi:uncharacterized protein HemY